MTNSGPDACQPSFLLGFFPSAVPRLALAFPPSAPAIRKVPEFTKRAIEFHHLRQADKHGVGHLEIDSSVQKLPSAIVVIVSNVIYNVLAPDYLVYRENGHVLRIVKRPIRISGSHM